MSSGKINGFRDMLDDETIWLKLYSITGNYKILKQISYKRDDNLSVFQDVFLKKYTFSTYYKSRTMQEIFLLLLKEL